MTKVVRDKDGTSFVDSDSSETNEVPVVAGSVLIDEPGALEDAANANGGVTVSGYLSGTLGVWAASLSVSESKCCGGGSGVVVSRGGGG